jgi:mannonate dehydratase
VLLAHTGEELAVFSGGGQEFGNPLRLRRPLEMGVRVVALHSATFGRSIDLDSPGRERVPSFELFLRLMDDRRYAGLLYSDIAGVTFFNHSAEALATLLDREDLHPRLVNGSDYPLPAINFLVMTGRLARHGFITDEERDALNEIYGYNPLLFDFVVKRTLRHPGTGRGFSPSVFTLPPAFPSPLR